MIASLPMYWRDENAHQWQAFWSHVRDAARDLGVDLPLLSAPDDLPGDWYAHWRDPDLALSMTCGLPFRSALKGQVTYIGTFEFGGLTCQPGYYYSRRIERPGLRGPGKHRLAYNSADSQSGWAASFHHDRTGPIPEYIPHIETGSHAASLQAVAEGRADVAFIDAVTLRILKRYDPNVKRVHIGPRTTPKPGLPLISALGTDPAPLRHVLRAATCAFAQHHSGDTEALGAMGGPIRFHVLDEQAYYDLPVPPPPTVA